MTRLGRYLPVLVVAWILFVFCNDATYSMPTLTGKGQRALLLTAHPDDECMFFAPTILSLIRNSVTLYSLCLSVGEVFNLGVEEHILIYYEEGDADGLGNRREQELKKSLQVLGIPSERSQVVNHPLLEDNITQEWRPEVVAEVVKPFIIAHNITTLLTFDQGGISQHPNHISLPNGISYLLTSPSPVVKIFTLTTVPLLNKYMGPLSSPLAKLWAWLPWTGNNHTYVAGFGGYLTAVRAMYQHQSQLVWFRWLYVLFSRYMWVNQWEEMPIHRGM